MSQEIGPVVPLEQQCVEPGHWLIEGRHVRATYEGRGRKILCWNVYGLDGETPPNPFWRLAEARDWIRDQI